MEVEFPPLVHRHEQPDDDDLLADSWTPDTGFERSQRDARSADIEENPTESSRMRLVGRAGSYDDAIRRVDDTVSTEVDAADIEPTVRYLPVPDRHDRPPADVVATIRQRTGIDVGDAIIDRSPLTTKRASEMGAVAFTEDGIVHLPADLGGLDDSAVRGVAAHELTHVAQHRRGDVITDEGSDEAQALESEARAVQSEISGGAAVRPLLLRTRPVVPVVPTGVQRLRDDVDQYEWQERGEPASARNATGVMGSIFGFLQLGQNENVQRDQERADREWAHDFERDNAGELQGKRDDKYDEIADDARRELEIRERRGDAPYGYDGDLDREDRIEVRRRLDDEMPWEFGPPPQIRLYPEQLGHARPAPPSSDPDGNGASSGMGSDSAASRVHAPTGARTLTGRQIGQRGTSRRHRGGPQSSRDDDNEFGWQRRDSTTRETIGLVFGGMLGTLLGKAVSDEDEDASRERREREQAGQLLTTRHDKEIDLRHVRLREKSAEVLREVPASAPGTPQAVPTFPLSLPDDDIVAIRQEVDSEMPLEFVMPTYVHEDRDAAVDEDGEFITRPEDWESTVVPEAEDEPSGTDADTDATVDADNADERGRSAAADHQRSTRSRGRGDVDVDDDDERDEYDTWGEGFAAMGLSLLTQGGSGLEADEERRERTAATDTDGDDHADDDIISTPLGELITTASEIDMDDLARRVYGRVRRELRHELLIDRERSGVLADVR